MKQPSVDILLPVYRPDPSFRNLLLRLTAQRMRADHILVLNVDERFWDPSLVPDLPEIEVFQVEKRYYDRGYLRDMGAGFSHADMLVCLDQRAVPADSRLLSSLSRPFRDPSVKAVFGAWEPEPGTDVLSAALEECRFPEERYRFTAADLPRLGSSFCFLSNVCAAYDRAFLQEAGGFTSPCICGEDELFAGRVLRAGMEIVYTPSACVRYSPPETSQLRREFDRGVAQALHPEIYGEPDLKEEEKRYAALVEEALREAGASGRIPEFRNLHREALIGRKLGRRFRSLPPAAVKRLTRNRLFWTWQGGE